MAKDESHLTQEGKSSQGAVGARRIDAAGGLRSWAGVRGRCCSACGGDISSERHFLPVWHAVSREFALRRSDTRGS